MLGDLSGLESSSTGAAGDLGDIGSDSDALFLLNRFFRLAVILQQNVSKTDIFSSSIK